MLALFGVGGFFTYTFFFASTDESVISDSAQNALPPELSDEPDVFMEGATITQFTPAGLQKYTLFSERLRYFEQEQLTRLNLPKMTLFREQKPENEAAKTEITWVVTSKHGYIRQRSNNNSGAGVTKPQKSGQEVVFLKEKVTLSNRSSPRTELVLHTDTLYVYPHRQFAETDQPVMIDSTVGRTKAAGFSGDLKTGRLNLLSSPKQRVHTIVLPDQIKQ